jgi:hypothetical protein
MILRVEKRTNSFPILTYYTFYVSSSGKIPYVSAMRYSESISSINAPVFRWVDWNRSERYAAKDWIVHENPKRIPQIVQQATVRGIFQEPIE